MINLENHIKVLHEFGGMKVVPYEIVLEYLKQLEEDHVNKLEQALSNLDSAIKSLNENTD
jgi:hypothetical protein